MKTMTQWLALASITALCLSNSAFAQEEAIDANRGDRGGRGPGGFGGDRGNFDPAQFREQMEKRMMESVRERLEIKDDTEWSAIEPLIKKVNDLRTQQVAGGMRGMFGRGRGGDRGGDSGRGGGMFGEASAEQTALSEAVDNNASKEDLKAKMEAFRKARDKKAAELKAAQDTLKKVLTTKQEAVALQMGLVN